VKVNPLNSLNSQDVVCVFGRGHSGTRIPTQLLQDNGVFMGTPLNKSMDLIGTNNVYYSVCRMAGYRARHITGGLWNLKTLISGTIPNIDKQLSKYLSSIINREGKRGWKLPETGLIYPWLARMFPEMSFVYWVRDPRDVIQGPHITDILGAFDVPCPLTDDVYMNRALSWKFQFDIMFQTPAPKNFLMIRYEDFLEHPEREVKRLGDFVGIEIKNIPPPRKDRMQLWRNLPRKQWDYDFLKKPLLFLGYPLD